jgi:DNA repair protein RadA/Sms
MEDVISEGGKKEKDRRSITEFSSPVITLDKAVSSNIEKKNIDINELDRVLGGGLVSGQVILLAGPPGIGKSTLMLEAAGKIAGSGQLCLYVSGEESLEQISIRANRLSIKNQRIYLMAETNLIRIIDEIKKIKPAVVIIDSIQTLYHPEIPSISGSLTQIRETASELLKLAKQNSITMFILGHITKDGELAGPKILEHMVDTVLYFDSEKTGVYRILRVNKNRFGPIDEIGFFEMTEKGLIPANKDIFLEDEKISISGRANTVLFEGTRPVVSQIESLTNKTFYPYPKRVITGIDNLRAQMLIAAIEKNTSLNFDNYDIFASVHGGFKTKDTAADLAFCASIISSFKNIPLPYDFAFIGEVGILARVSSVHYLSKRIMELERLGFKHVFIPYNFKDKLSAKLELIKIQDISQLYKHIINIK